MFSNRLPDNFDKNALTLLLEQRSSQGLPVCDLTQSNPTQAGIVYPAEAIAQALAEGAREPYAPDARGLRSAREILARHYAAQGAAIDPEHIHLTAGTSEAYAHLFKILCSPGDTVLLPQPSYPLFESLCALEGVRTERFDLSIAGGRWRLDRESFARACRASGAKAALFVHPNNPTGSLIHKDDLAYIRRMCQKHSLALIADEVFLDYADHAFPEAAGTLAGGREGPLTFVLNGLSKTAGLPQLKLSWILTGGDPAPVRGAVERLDIVNDTFLSCAGPVQRSLGALLKAGETVKAAISRRIAENFGALQSFPLPEGWRILPREAGWYAVLQLPSDIEEESFVLSLLEKEGVLAHPGFFYDFAEGSHLVLSLLPPPQDFARGLAGIARTGSSMAGA